MRTVLLLNLFLLIQFCTFSQEKWKVQASYIVDKNSQLQKDHLNWSTSKPLKEGELVKLGYNANDAFWIKIKVQNTSEFESKQFVSFGNIHIDSLELLNKRVVLYGDRTRNNSPFLTAFTYPLELNAHADTTLIFRLKKGISFVEFSFDIQNEEHLMNETRQRTLIVSFFLGIVFLLLMINAILWYSTRKKVYFYYLIYSFLTGAYVLMTTGMMKYYFMSGFIYFSELRIYVGSLWFVVLGLFLGDFMQLRIRQFKLHKWINVLSSVNLGLITGSLFFLFIGLGEAIKFFTALAYLDFLIVIFLLVLASVRHIRFQKAEGIYALLAFLPMIIWVVVFILNVFGILAKEPDSDWLVLSSLYEVFLFGFVLTRNYIAAFQEETRLQRLVLQQKEEALQLINKVQIRERIELSHLIHDKFGSSMSTIRSMLRKKEAEEAEELLREMASELRNLSHTIMPKSLEDGALFSALASQLNLIQEANEGLNIHLQRFDFPDRIALEIAQPVYLIVLELINNALRHGKATVIMIELFGYDDQFVLQVEDNGIGFDQGSTEDGFGIQAIKSRVFGLEGTVEISSEKHEGTQVLITIPINK